MLKTELLRYNTGGVGIIIRQESNIVHFELKVIVELGLNDNIEEGQCVVYLIWVNIELMFTYRCTQYDYYSAFNFTPFYYCIISKDKSNMIK